MSSTSFGDEKPVVDVPSTIRAFSLSGSLSPLLLIPMAVPVLAALFAPDDILNLWSWLRRFTLWVQHLFPIVPLSAHAASTTYSQAALLTHCLTLVVIPIASLVWLWQGVVNYPRLLARSRARGGMSVAQYLMSSVVGVPLILGCVYFFMALPGDPSFAKGVTTHSRIGFAFLTLAALYGASMVLGTQLLVLRLFIDTNFRKGA